MRNKSRRKPVVGETLYMLNVGNDARGCKQVLTPAVVKKVGRKYFTLNKGWRDLRFNVSDWSEASNYSPCAKLYEFEQEWEDEKECDQLSKQIARAFEYGRNNFKLPLSVLREMNTLIEDNKEKINEQ